jgi:hypothetical protein
VSTLYDHVYQFLSFCVCTLQVNASLFVCIISTTSFYPTNLYFPPFFYRWYPTTRLVNSIRSELRWHMLLGIQEGLQDRLVLPTVLTMVDSSCVMLTVWALEKVFIQLIMTWHSKPGVDLDHFCYSHICTSIFCNVQGVWYVTYKICSRCTYICVDSVLCKFEICNLCGHLEFCIESDTFRFCLTD